MANGRLQPLDRPEFVRDVESVGGDVDIVVSLTLWERLTRIDAVRQATLLVILAALWQAYAVFVSNPLILPTLSDTLDALWHGLLDGPLLLRAWTSIKLLVTGYVLGTVFALLLTFAAISSRTGTDLLNLLTAMFNPLPAIALLPLALLWFGIGEGSLIFVLVHAVLWPLALNTYSGIPHGRRDAASRGPEFRTHRSRALPSRSWCLPPFRQS